MVYWVSSHGLHKYHLLQLQTRVGSLSTVNPPVSTQYEGINVPFATQSESARNVMFAETGEVHTVVALSSMNSLDC